MKFRFEEYDKKWLYDSRDEILYDIVDGDCYPSKNNIIKLSKFNPYARVTGRYVTNPYNVRTRCYVDVNDLEK